ncbi:MAG: 4Fe-4S dicluster domain-containing protein, partial [Deltaproteobacteria bacterium]|nr:4Fe-4S dicluster domain-containing protein [Deltaproteobacteria bacterium]
VFLSSVLPPFQFVPALIRVITAPEALFVFGLAAILVVSLVFGRVYCSFLCPLGSLQDIFIVLSRRVGLRRKHSFRKPANILRYAILAATTATAAFGSMIFLIFLDPYSLTGRFIAHLVEPVFVRTTNAGIQALKHADVYFFAKETAFIPMSVLAVTLAFFMVVLILSLKYGRLYCNTVCPVGTFLGILSRVSLFKLAIDGTGCNQCGRCEMICKAGCIDAASGSIDESRCVGCFDCLDVCPKAVIRYATPWRKAAAGDEWSPARRGFLAAAVAGAGALFFAFLAGVRNIFGAAAHAGSVQNLPVTAPGSIDLAHFKSACTACHLCVSACPTHVLTPSVWNFGMPVFMQPVLDFEKSFCEYGCNVCGRVCPTGAILPLALEEKQLIQIGEAKLLEDKCVVYVDGNNCGACGEVCPTHAIAFTDKENVLYPRVEAQYCTGCGACQLVCPTAPKAIVVLPNAVHKKAERYMPEAAPEKKSRSADEGFPF